eukprot:CAMPEP_0183746956 /NCGR_PEP_ID=MMETSP0737-20130205/67020_1 /TAXON_ID=385413 /ORGANISM="Thalassiosira miniscula, Strain CCMP1093" /LENGTH=406 /DNA_ID=CAMNT_0025982663 /DNA_START=266 /DNA_END=1486 /DNA_ORIENTATION=-
MTYPSETMNENKIMGEVDTTIVDMDDMATELNIAKLALMHDKRRMKQPQNNNSNGHPNQQHPRPRRRVAQSELAQDIDDDHNDDDNPSSTTNNSNSNSKKNIRLPESYNGRNSLFLFSSQQPIPAKYSLSKSTQGNYAAEDGVKDFYGPFQEIRSRLDYNYHGNYSKERQLFQDKIVEKQLDGTTIVDRNSGRVCKTPTEPWIVFTAGVMGAGKSHTMKQLSSKGLFPLQSYVVVDPDEIRSHFPEYHLYAQRMPQRAGELTHREAGYLTEIVTEAAMQRGHNVLVDGSLKDSDWYSEYFKSLRKKYKGIRIAILHITAPRAAVLERAKNRAKDTGRVVPIETLELSLKQVPISVRKLAPQADFFCELDNSPTSKEVMLQTEGITWDSFLSNWAQTCLWVPDHGKM